jgi:hypothetical protein
MISHTPAAIEDGSNIEKSDFGYVGSEFEVSFDGYCGMGCNMARCSSGDEESGVSPSV